MVDLRCPTCRAEVFRHQAINHCAPIPQPGDFAVCQHCGNASTFDLGDFGELVLRPSTPYESARLDKHPAVAATRLAIARNPTNPIEAAAEARARWQLPQQLH